MLLKRGLRNVAVQGVTQLTVAKSRIAGPAYTLRYIPAREDLDVLEVFKDPEHPQRAAVERIPPEHVLVMDCRGDASAASAWAILAARLQYRGCAGIVTDGGIRDSETIAEMDMPVFCGGASAPANLTRHHAVDINQPVGCGNVAVYPGDIIVGDADGVIVVPAELADDIAAEAPAMTRFEDWAMEKVVQGRGIVGLYPPDDKTSREYQLEIDGSVE